MVEDSPQIRRTVTLDFYDGEVGGFAEMVDRSGTCVWYQYELVCWDAAQNSRIFCLSPLSNADALLATVESEVPDELLRLRRETKAFTVIILSDSRLKNVSASCSISADLQTKLPKEFPNYDSRDFEFWQSVIDGLRSR